MRHPDGNSFAERRKTAENARRKLLTKFASAPKVTDPAMQERLAAREATARTLGVLTLTPYDYWCRAHAAHHASAGISTSGAWAISRP
jgi:hypothetical protein